MCGIVFQFLKSKNINKEVYINGQYHCIYSLGLAGVPFVAIKSNSHKIEELIKWSGLKIPISQDGQSIDDAITYAQNNKNIYLQFQYFLFKNRVLS
jgi:hypothetical protein